MLKKLNIMQICKCLTIKKETLRAVKLLKIYDQRNRLAQTLH